MSGRILRNSLLIWVAIIPLAIANGAFREYVLIPLMGNIGLTVSGILICIIIFLMVLLFLPKLGKATAVTYAKMGLLWGICTIVFETLLGVLSGASWEIIVENYNFLTGNIWLFVVVFIGLVPWLVAKLKKII